MKLSMSAARERKSIRDLAMSRNTRGPNRPPGRALRCAARPTR